MNGAAVGFGFTILLHCEIVLVSETVRLQAPFVPLRTAPEAASSVLLPRQIGHQQAAEILFTGR